MIKHPIVTVKGTEKADLQFSVRRFIDHFGATPGCAQFPVGLPASVEYVDASIRPERIICCDAFAAFLETLFITRNLEPASQILLEVDRLGGLWN